MQPQELDYKASEKIECLIDRLGRTEDIRFSPDGRWLAVVDYENNRVVLFEISVEVSGSSHLITLSSYISVGSEYLNRPHGIDFLNDEYFIVANRKGALTLFRVPKKCTNDSEVELDPVVVIKEGVLLAKMSSPGSVACIKVDDNRYYAMACNNYVDTITLHEIRLADDVHVTNKGILIRNGLSIPDGISVSPDQRWISVSNHVTGTVLIYRFSPLLNRFTAPSATLTGAVCPHGVRFSGDGKKIFVSDAASQYLHIYESKDGNWSNNIKPLTSVKILSDITFSNGRYNAQEGGIKGVDISDNYNLIAVTCEHQKLAFYAMNKLTEMPVDTAYEQDILEKSIHRDHELSGKFTRIKILISHVLKN